MFVTFAMLATFMMALVCAKFVIFVSLIMVLTFDMFVMLMMLFICGVYDILDIKGEVFILDL